MVSYGELVEGTCPFFWTKCQKMLKVLICARTMLRLLMKF